MRAIVLQLLLNFIFLPDAVWRGADYQFDGPIWKFSQGFKRICVREYNCRIGLEFRINPVPRLKQSILFGTGAHGLSQERLLKLLRNKTIGED